MKTTVKIPGGRPRGSEAPKPSQVSEPSSNGHSAVPTSTGARYFSISSLF